MKLPNQSQPVIRSQVRFSHRQLLLDNSKGTGIQASSFLCSPCKSIVGGLGSTLEGMGCTEAAAAFEIACNAALDVESLGLASIPCTAASVALGYACKKGAGAVTQGMIDSVAAKACSWAC